MPLDRAKNKANNNYGTSKAGLTYGAGPTYGAGHAEGDMDETSGKILAAGSGTSIFDPVLCELAYRWFCPVGGAILDPFAGGSVRGIVAGILGREYTGLELRPEQVEANRDQVGIVPDGSPVPKWIVTDSAKMDDVLPPEYMADMVFSCPPYADLEVYSDTPEDLSTMDYPDFIRVYREIIAKAVNRMKPDTFACFVVGEVRAKNGDYYGFVPDTIQAFADAGAPLYNEAILVTAVGSLPIRAAKQFNASRKLGKTHQNVLVFVKGDGKKATKKIGAVEFGDVPDQAADE